MLIYLCVNSAFSSVFALSQLSSQLLKPLLIEGFGIQAKELQMLIIESVC